MAIEQSATIRRDKDGSIDFRHYQNKGRIARSRSAHSLFAGAKRRVLNVFDGNELEKSKKTNAKIHKVLYRRNRRQFRATPTGSKLRNAA